MKIHILSDVHLEFDEYYYDPPEEADVVVLAGDIGVNTQGIDWAKEMFENIPVIYVLGNHEYYEKKLPFKGGADILKEYANGSNVHVLNNDSKEIDGVRFLGTTLWTNMNLQMNQNSILVQAHKIMNDYRQIVYEGETELKGFQTIDAHNESVKFLEREFSKEFDGRTVVVTHHLPSEKGCYPEYARNINDSFNPFYASDLDEMIKDCKAKLWIFGHIHHPKDFVIGDTRLICNPHGYAYFEKTEINNKLLIDV